MGQIKRCTVADAAQPVQQDILEKVVIRPDFYQHWLDALGKFAGMMRLQKGMGYVVHIEKEKAFISTEGDLTIITGVSNETLQMAFPEGTWKWKDSEVN